MTTRAMSYAKSTRPTRFLRVCPLRARDEARALAEGAAREAVEVDARDIDAKRARNRKKMAERAADRAKMDQTTLRNERLKRLSALQAANGDGVGERMIPDGVASASRS